MCLQVCAIAVYMFSLISKYIQDRCNKPFETRKPLNIGEPKSRDKLEFGERGSQQKKTTKKKEKNFPCSPLILASRAKRDITYGIRAKRLKRSDLMDSSTYRYDVSYLI